MPRPLAVRRPIWAVLVVAQAGACALQLASGFVPLKSAPRRVALSWDMFAPAVSRCAMRFLPPLPPAAGWRALTGDAPLASLRQLGLPLEWDLVFDHVDNYVAAGRGLCSEAHARAELHLQCFTPDGARSDFVVACP